MKTRYIVLSLSLCMGLAACSNSSNKSTKSDSAVPATLSFNKPAAGQALTQDQATEIKSTFAGKATMTLPPGELIFPDSSMSPEQKAREEQQLAQQDPNAYNMLLDIRKGCAKSHPSFQMDATFPTDSINNDNAFDVLQKGDKIGYSYTAGLSGGACPADVSVSAGLNAEVKDIDSQKRTGSADANSANKLSAVIKNPKYAQLLNTRGIIVNSNLSGLAIVQDGKPGSSSLLATFKVAGTYLSLTSDIPYSTQYQVLTHSKGEDSTVEMVSTTELKMPKFTASLVIHVTSKNEEEGTTEMYLNGQSVTSDQLNKIFGNTDAAPQVQYKQMRKLLLN